MHRSCLWKYLTTTMAFCGHLPRNLLNGQFDDSHELPTDCTCDPSNCLTDDNSTKGMVIINCAIYNGEQYFHQIDTGDFNVVGAAPVQQVTLSNSGGLAVMTTKHLNELHQDILIMSNVTTERNHATFSLITSFPASPNDKSLLPDGSVIIPVNGSDMDIVCYVKPEKDGLIYSTLLNSFSGQLLPRMTIPLLTDLVNVSIIGLRGTPNLLAAEVMSNNIKHIIYITAELLDPHSMTTVQPSQNMPTIIYKTGPSSQGVSISQRTSTRAPTSNPPIGTVAEEKVTPNPQNNAVTEERVTSDPQTDAATEERVTSNPQTDAITEERVTSNPQTDAVTEERVTSNPQTDAVTEEKQVITCEPPVTTAAVPTDEDANEVSFIDCKLHVSFAVVLSILLLLLVFTGILCCLYCHRLQNQKREYYPQNPNCG